MTAPVALLRHPDCGADAIRGIEVYVQRSPGGALSLQYVLAGDASAVSMPPEAWAELRDADAAARSSAPVDARRADELWRHTCFEVFVTGRGGSYVEFNFAPARAWAGYRFSGYREGMTALEQQRAPDIQLQRTAHGLALHATVLLPEPQRHALARAALAAVIEDTSGRLSYWALRHPPGRPDFHHPSSFGLEI
ncbi:MAG TPA: DOMON-like domain-containing protein [Steroidobacteraceae bacterium]|nr:DOMON-like domain-containing protein [Steroidobacteraceae bacterium]